jgi:CubicO group peptidase (beta-lactamase class C family)
MYNEYVTQEFTIRDLLTHRSGLGLGAGDLMIWPDGSNFTATDITKLTVFKASFRIQNQI